MEGKKKKSDCSVDELKALLAETFTTAITVTD